MKLKNTFFPLLTAFALSTWVAKANFCVQVKHEITQKVVEICGDTLQVEKNIFSDSFSKAKRKLKNKVYNNIVLPRNTFYCGCNYSDKKVIDAQSCWFQHSGKHISRSNKIEWEHVVPAETFGQSFVEWREGHNDCVSSKWKVFKWKKCVSKVNREYRYMQSDMYNLFPAIWSINALRSNYSFAMIPWEKRKFWECDMEIENRKAEPREEIRGDIARVYYYMDLTYPWRWIIWGVRKKLFKVWNAEDPVSEEECMRYKAIKEVQGNENVVLSEVCK